MQTEPTLDELIQAWREADAAFATVKGGFELSEAYDRLEGINFKLVPKLLEAYESLKHRMESLEK